MTLHYVAGLVEVDVVDIEHRAIKRIEVLRELRWKLDEKIISQTIAENTGSSGIWPFTKEASITREEALKKLDVRPYGWRHQMFMGEHIIEDVLVLCNEAVASNRKTILVSADVLKRLPRNEETNGIPS